MRAPALFDVRVPNVPRERVAAFARAFTDGDDGRVSELLAEFGWSMTVREPDPLGRSHDGRRFVSRRWRVVVVPAVSA